VEEPRFDLAASLLRADTSDARALAGALADKLCTALPDHTKVRHKPSRFLSRQKRIEQVEIQLGDEAFTLTLTGAGARAVRAKTVGGVVIRRQELELDRWLEALDQALAAEAQRSETARLALERLLE
jgi:hypothetical protein